MKAIEEANKDDAKMEQLMFDRTEPINKEMKHLHLNKSGKGISKKQPMRERRTDIFQPNSSKDMRRVRGE